MKIVSGQKVRLKSFDEIEGLTLRGDWLSCGVKLTGQQQWLGEIVTVNNVYDGNSFDIIEDHQGFNRTDCIYTLNMIKEVYPVDNEAGW